MNIRYGKKNLTTTLRVNVTTKTCWTYLKSSFCSDWWPCRVLLFICCDLWKRGYEIDYSSSLTRGSIWMLFTGNFLCIFDLIISQFTWKSLSYDHKLPIIQKSVLLRSLISIKLVPSVLIFTPPNGIIHQINKSTLKNACTGFTQREKLLFRKTWGS